MVLARPFVMETVAMAKEGFALPAGTVTFLLTDVEGSTRLWETRAPEMGPAIARHYAILDDAIQRFDGVRPVEQGEGDSVVAAFARAADAVQAALVAQLALQLEVPWLGVRMAIHTGEAQLRDEGNYVGRTIIRCARLRSCGHGGQVLVSEPTAALVADDLPAGVSLVDLGVARLRDLARSERVWQLAHPELRREFPPLRSLDIAPHNLPTPLDQLRRPGCGPADARRPCRRAPAGDRHGLGWGGQDAAGLAGSGRSGRPPRCRHVVGGARSSVDRRRGARTSHDGSGPERGARCRPRRHGGAALPGR